MARYMFSESAGLLCYAVGNKYEVLNGCWEGTRDGDKFTVHNRYPADRVVEIKDWVEVYPRYWSPEWQREWYYKR